MARKTKKIQIDGKALDGAVKTIFKEILMPYQVKWITDNSIFKICNKSRQIGLSEAIALEGLLDVLYKNENSFYVSRSQRQSVELLDKFNKWLAVFADLGIKIPKTIDTRTECKINGCDVKSLTSNACTGEGFTGNVYLDEFALQKDDEQIYKSLFPTISLGYKIKIVSRPFGQSNMFYKIWSGHNGQYKDYSKHQISIYDAVKLGWKVNIDLLKRNIDDEGFAENYECLFLDESTSYFTYELLKACIEDSEEEVKGNCWMGIDVGRTNDATVILVLCLGEDGKYRIVEKKEIKNMKFSKQRYEIAELIRKHNPVKCEIDKGSVGFQLAEDLESDFPKVVEGVFMNDNLKMEAFPKVKKLFEEKSLVIADDIDFINQVHSIKRDFGNGGTVKFWAERNSKGHADSAFALALAVHSTSNTKKRNVQILYI